MVSDVSCFCFFGFADGLVVVLGVDRFILWTPMAHTVRNDKFTFLDNPAVKPEIKNCMTFVERELQKQQTYICHDCYAPPDYATWPTRTHIHCWHDGHAFDTVPIPIVNHYDPEANQYFVFGVFCSVNCAKAYIIEHDPFISSTRMLMFNHMMTQVFKHKLPIKPAPPRIRLSIYGGQLNLKQFRAHFRHIHSSVVRPPFTSASQFIVETKHVTTSTVPDASTQGANIYEHFIAKQGDTTKPPATTQSPNIPMTDEDDTPEIPDTHNTLSSFIRLI